MLPLSSYIFVAPTSYLALSPLPPAKPKGKGTPKSKARDASHALRYKRSKTVLDGDDSNDDGNEDGEEDGADEDYDTTHWNKM